MAQQDLKELGFREHVTVAASQADKAAAKPDKHKQGFVAGMQR